MLFIKGYVLTKPWVQSSQFLLLTLLKKVGLEFFVSTTGNVCFFTLWRELAQTFPSTISLRAMTKHGKFSLKCKCFRDIWVWKWAYNEGCLATCHYCPAESSCLVTLFSLLQQCDGLEWTFSGLRMACGSYFFKVQTWGVSRRTQMGCFKQEDNFWGRNVTVSDPSFFSIVNGNRK